MSELILKVGKKGAIYLPKKVMRRLNIKEGDKFKLRIEDDKIVLEPIKNPFTLALTTKKWAKTTVEEFERESEEMQNELY